MYLWATGWGGGPLGVPPELAEVGGYFDWCFSSTFTFGSPGKVEGEKGEI